ncbi:cupin domain-containing protein [Indiicoccus explosivorum]|uniref:cupin domain-containing protein n=1 Tax=Indiicoccus explosivorum TaxID=1917864 RepID=UPI000B443347|nr:cupin domain-containing protein [Indiicoccus explosivorum]
MEQLQTFRFDDDGRIPNNPHLPVLLYEGAFRTDPDRIERAFNENGWTNSWTDGVFDYHHYHSNTHEVLGVKSGTAELQLGGEGGKTFTVRTGDVAVLPAGTGHKRLSASEDFQVVGAYPDGLSPNKKLGEPEERPYALEQIASVPLPAQDPVRGEDGPLFNTWM